MVGIIDKKITSKKYRLLTSFFIVMLSIILLIYAIISDEPIMIMVIFLLIIKIVDLTFILFRFKKKEHQHRFYENQKLRFEVRYG